MTKQARKEELLKELRQLIVAARTKYWKLELLRREELENRHLRIKVGDSREIPEEAIEKHTLEAYKLKFILKRGLRIFVKVNQFKKCEDFRIHCKFISIFCKSDFPNTIKHVCLDFCPHDVGNSIYWAAVLFDRLAKGTCIMPIARSFKSLSDYYYYEEERLKWLQRMTDYINYERNKYNEVNKMFGYIGLISHINQVKSEILTIRDRIKNSDITFEEVKRELFDWIICYYATDREHVKPMLQDWILQVIEAAKNSQVIQFKKEKDAISAIKKMIGKK